MTTIWATKVTVTLREPNREKTRMVNAPKQNVVTFNLAEGYVKYSYQRNRQIMGKAATKMLIYPLPDMAAMRASPAPLLKMGGPPALTKNRTAATMHIIVNPNSAPADLKRCNGS
ncbi:MAG: hypothetical protein Kow0025_23050 [Thermodesulfovibrionales bacterium]